MSIPKRYRLSITRISDGGEITTDAEGLALSREFRRHVFQVLATGMAREVVDANGRALRLERKEIEA